VYGRAPGYFLVSGFLGGTYREVCLLVLAPLEEGAGGVNEQARFPLGDVDRAQVDAARDIHGGARVAESHSDVHAVELGIGRAERGPAKVAVVAKSSCCFVGFAE
jgi:hypothetical protein